MIDAVRLIFESILISILFIVPGILLDIWLEKGGIARGDKTVIVITTLCLVAIKQLWFRNLSWWWWGLGIVLALVFSVHRRDMTETWKRGRWWWNTKSRKK